MMQDAIGDALSTKTQQKVLGLLFGKPDKSFYTNEIIRWASIGRGTVSRELNRLVTAGMTLEQLDNLVKINRRKKALPDQKEFDGMVASAKRHLQDAEVRQLSDEGHFSQAYGAAHAISLAAQALTIK